MTAAQATSRGLAVVSLLILCACDDLVPRDTASLLKPTLQRSEIVGFLAGFGTTFAAVPDLLAMLRRRSTAGMNPRMATIMFVFQILWVYYGLLIASRPVIAWNLIAVCVNFLSVAAYRRFRKREQARRRYFASSGMTKNISAMMVYTVTSWMPLCQFDWPSPHTSVPRITPRNSDPTSALPNDSSIGAGARK